MMSDETVSIGKALLERSAVAAKIADITTRITNNSVAVINDKGERMATAEDPSELVRELNILEARHHLISTAIINANYNTVVKFENHSYRIIEVVEMIERCKKNIKRLKDLITHIESNILRKGKSSRYDYGESKETYISTFDLAELRKNIEKESQVKNRLQVLLQEANWGSPVSY